MKIPPQTLYNNLYGYLHNYRGVPVFFLTPFRRIIRKLINQQVPKFFEKHHPDLTRKRSDVIVSLTSFPARINSVHLVIQCLLHQRVLPKKILLWLAKEQFPLGLPDNLRNLESDIFEIRMVDEDYRSHKKYYYVFREYPEDWILLVDDDLFYPDDMIEKMIAARDKYKETIICRYGCPLYPQNGIIPKHLSWWTEYDNDDIHDKKLFFGSGGGTLVKKALFDERVTDITLARQLTPLADDIWLNAMANVKGTDKFKIGNGLLLPIKIENNKELWRDNLGEDFNDVQFDAIINYFKNEGVFPF